LRSTGSRIASSGGVYAYIAAAFGTAKQIATDPTATAQTSIVIGANGPTLAASVAGITKALAPTTIPMMLAAKPQVPITRTKPASRRFSAIAYGNT
jgi:hypothetical protein